jgi:hypothetical protein
MSWVLIVAGIGLLRSKSWGRKLSIVFAIYGILIGLVSAMVFYLYVIGPAISATPDEPVHPLQNIPAYQTTLVIIAPLIYPIVLFFFMRRQVLIDALAVANGRKF